MKKVILVCFSLLMGLGVFAQKPAKTVDEKVNNQSARLTKELGLSTEQVEKVKVAIKTRIEAADAVKAKYTDTQKKERNQELKPIREKFKTDLNSILTADQKTKWEALKEKRKENKGKKGPKGAKPNPNNQDGLDD